MERRGGCGAWLFWISIGDKWHKERTNRGIQTGVHPCRWWELSICATQDRSHTDFSTAHCKDPVCADVQPLSHTIVPFILCQKTKICIFSLQAGMLSLSKHPRACSADWNKALQHMRFAGPIEQTWLGWGHELLECNVFSKASIFSIESVS